ncbi:MAG: hypothetical protein GY906_24395 [bacterium]|nr:hypothetical protein [bacterium]
MSATTMPKDFSDLFTDLQNRVRVQTSVTATENQAKRYINIALEDMHIGFREKVPWAERDAQLRTHDDYTTGTISVSQGGTTLTGSSTAWNTNNSFSETNMQVGGKIVINGGNEVYQISAVPSDTSATISSEFTQSDVSGGTYVYFEDEYALHADFLRVVDLQFFSQADEIILIDRKTFRRRYPRNNVVGKPQVATIVTQEFSGDTTPVQRVRFWKPPNDTYLIPYTYITNKLAVTAAGVAQESLDDDTDEPIVWRQYRHAIVFHALYHWYRDKKNDTRAAQAEKSYTDLMLRIASDQEIGAPRASAQPVVGPYARSARRPYNRRGKGRFTTGTSFDELRS